MNVRTVINRLSRSNSSHQWDVLIKCGWGENTSNHHVNKPQSRFVVSKRKIQTMQFEQCDTLIMWFESYCMVLQKKKNPSSSPWTTRSGRWSWRAQMLIFHMGWNPQMLLLVTSNTISNFQCLAFREMSWQLKNLMMSTSSSVSWLSWWWWEPLSS